MGWKRQLHTVLDRRGLRFALTAAGTVYATVRAKTACRIFYHNYSWVHEYPGGVLVEPEIILSTQSEIEGRTVDAWTYQYTPVPGDVVLDIGAGTGWDTLFFSRQVGGSGRVISIEPHPRAFHCLEEMCRRNRLSNVVLLKCAVASLEAAVLISDNVKYHANTILGNRQGVPVLCCTLDKLLADLHVKYVDLLKMNIEGAEQFAIAGMSNTIRKTRYCCISCHDFLADEEGREDMRSKAIVTEFLKRNDLEVTTRDSECHRSIRDVVYASNRLLNSRAAEGSQQSVSCAATSQKRPRVQGVPATEAACKPA